MEANLCKCNNCNRLLIDRNPQDGASTFEVPRDLLETVKIEEENSWGCPKCKTDQYLTDVAAYPIEQSYIMGPDDVVYAFNELQKWINKGIKDADKLNDKKAKRLFYHFSKNLAKILTTKE